jgi:hypothetical protein
MIFLSGEKEEVMDKVSAVLIMCIVMLIGINSTIIYNVWIKDEEYDAVEVYANNSIGNGDLIFNDDTSMLCVSDKDLWIRAKIIYVENPVSLEITNKGYWNEAEDGWYYCNEKITLGDETLPLINDMIYEDNKGKFRLQVEAVDESWLDVKPQNCGQAFRMLEELYSEQDIKELL